MMLIIGPSHHSLGFLRGGGDGGTETGARTRTGKDGDLGEKKRRDKRGRGCWLLAAADSSTGPKAWLGGAPAHSGGRGPKPKQGRLGIGWLQNKTLLVPSESVLGSQRLSGTSAGYRIHSTPLVCPL